MPDSSCLRGLGEADNVFVGWWGGGYFDSILAGCHTPHSNAASRRRRVPIPTHKIVHGLLSREYGSYRKRHLASQGGSLGRKERGLT